MAKRRGQARLDSVGATSSEQHANPEHMGLPQDQTIKEHQGSRKLHQVRLLRKRRSPVNTE